MAELTKEESTRLYIIVIILFILAGIFLYHTWKTDPDAQCIHSEFYCIERIENNELTDHERDRMKQVWNTYWKRSGKDYNK